MGKTRRSVLKKSGLYINDMVCRITGQACRRPGKCEETDEDATHRYFHLPHPFTVSSSYIYENNFMGRLSSPPSKYGTYCHLCVYPMWGESFVRTASSLTAKRVKTAPEFKLTMAWADRLKAASRLGSAVYAMLPAYRKKHKLFRTLTGMAMRLLQEGKTDGETVVALMLFIQFKKKKRTARPVVSQEEAPAIRCRRRPIRSGNSFQKAMQRIGRTRSLYSPYAFLCSRISNGMTRKVISDAPG